MGFFLRKRIKIAPGVRLNIGAKQGSVSIGGAGVGFNAKAYGKGRRKQAARDDAPRPLTSVNTPRRATPAGPVSRFFARVSRFVTRLFAWLILVAALVTGAIAFGIRADKPAESAWKILAVAAGLLLIASIRLFSKSRPTACTLEE